MYPENYPMPDHTGVSGSIDVGLRRTAVPAALANQVKTHNSPVDSLTLTFSMTNDEYSAWLDWVRTYAWQWFQMPIVSRHTPVNITSTRRLRFISDVQYEKRGDNWCSVTVQAEILPADAEDPDAPVPEYDWIIAGAPDDPSTDWALAGSPTSPSTDWTISHLYYWGNKR
jgi:hypothetical protein